MTTTEEEESSASPSSSFLPAIIRTVDLDKYPDLKDSKHLNHTPGGALIERDMMFVMRRTCCAAFFLTPLEFYYRYKKAFLPERQKQLSILKMWQRNFAYGAAGGAALGALRAIATYWFCPEAQLVREALELRRDPEGDRWSRTSARLASMTMLPMLLYTKGPIHLRIGNANMTGSTRQ